MIIIPRYLENERNILPWLAFIRNHMGVISLAAHDSKLLDYICVSYLLIGGLKFLAQRHFQDKV